MYNRSILEPLLVISERVGLGSRAGAAEGGSMYRTVSAHGRRHRRLFVLLGVLAVEVE